MPDCRRVRGVLPDHLRRLGDLDARQLGCLAQQRVEADPDAGHDHAAEILRLRRNAVEGGGRAEIHDDSAALEALEGRHRVHDAVGSDVARVIVDDADPGLGPGPDHQGHLAHRVTDRLGHHVGERRHDAGDDRGVDPARVRRPEREQLVQEHAVLVGGARVHRREAKGLDQLAARIQTEDDVGISDVDGEQHGRGAYHQGGRTRTLWTTSPCAMRSQPGSARPISA